jgi:aerobic-type carbon monoxide dehydrogenase small subunit (CoxS/CutS family)
MTLTAFLRDNPNPSDSEIRDALSANLCRCTGYHHIFEAAKLACGRPLP